MSNTPTKKVPVTGALRVNVYAVLNDCVERGVTTGWNHAHKHVDTPGPEAIQQQVVDDVLNAICEYFDFSEPEE